MKKNKILFVALIIAIISPILTGCKSFFGDTGEVNGELFLNATIQKNQTTPLYTYESYGETLFSDDLITYPIVTVYLNVLEYVQKTDNVSYVGNRFKIEWSPYENPNEVYSLESNQFKYNYNYTSLIITIPFYRDLSNNNIIEYINGIQVKKLAESFIENKFALKVVSIDYESKEEDSLYKFSKIIDINNFLIKE